MNPSNPSVSQWSENHNANLASNRGAQAQAVTIFPGLTERRAD